MTADPPTLGNFLKQQLRLFLTAVMFLTRIPVRIQESRPEEIPRSTAYFSLVGLFIGFLAALPFAFDAPITGAIFSLIIMTMLTGALHEDGFADTCDGIFGAYQKKQRLEIMADSRVGTFGSIALWFLFTIRLLLLSQFASLGNYLLLVLPVVFAFSRTSSVILLAVLGKQRDEIGKENEESKVSKYFTEVGRKQAIFCGLITLVSSAMLLDRLSVVFYALLSAGLVAAIAGWYFRRKLGVLNGDALGAVVVLVELATMWSLLWAYEYVV